MLLSGAGIGALILLAIYVEALRTPPRIVTPARSPLPARNGFILLKAATRKITYGKEVSDALARTPKKRYTLEQKRGWVTANRAAITDTRNALAVPYLETNRSVSLRDEFPYYKKFRHMAYVLTLAGNVAWKEGKQKEAAGYYLDAVTIGRRVPNRCLLLGRMVGITCEVISRRAIWARLAKMDAATVTYCLARLQALQAEKLPYHVSLEEEKYTVQHMAIEMMNDPDRLVTFKTESPRLSESDRLVLRLLYIYRHVVPRQYVSDTVGAHLDKIIAQSKKPYITGNEELPLPKEMYTYIVVAPVREVRFGYVANETGDALLRTALALRLFRLRNGRYPLSLSELVSARLLTAVPDDPFDRPGTPLHYRQLPTGKYLLHSIGPDGTNDGGKGIDAQNVRRNKSPRGVEIDSTGDMVAGWYGY